MLKILLKRYWIILILMLSSVDLLAQNDFVTWSPTTDNFSGYCFPIQTGKSIKVPIKVKCNMTKKYQPYKVSINIPGSFYSQSDWVKIENNSLSVDSSKTITFNLTITPPKTPIFTIEGQYPFTLYFDIYNKDNTHLNPTINQPSFTVIVDNTAPIKPTPAVLTKKSNYISIEKFNTFDPNTLSSTYSLVNDTAGISGIDSLKFLLKRVYDGRIIDNTTSDVKNVGSFYTFKQNTTPITPNTTYTIFVTATDLARNANTSDGLLITTPPAPPTSCTITDRTYCSFTLTWPNSDGALGYYIYDASYKKITSSLVTGTTYHVSGLAIGTSYKYYISAYSNAGGESELSPAFTFSTLTRPSMVITGSSTLCASDVATYTVSNAPASYTLFWTYRPNLIYISGQGTNRLTVKASAGYLPPNDSLLQTSRQEQTGFSEINNESESSQSLTTTTNDYGSSSWVSVSATGECGSFPVSKTIWVGKPSFTPEIVGLTSLFPSQTSLYVEKNNGTVTWSTYGPLKTVGGGYGYKSTIKATGTGVGWVYATVSNICGSYRGELMVEVGGGTYSVYPNPATTEVTVTQTSQNTLTSRGTSSKVIKAIRIFDKSGNTFYYQKFSDEVSESKVNVSAFPAGIYYLKINEGAEEENYTIVKQ